MDHTKPHGSAYSQFSPFSRHTPTPGVMGGHGAGAYAQVSALKATESTSALMRSHQTIELLMDSSLSLMGRFKAALEQGDRALAGQCCSKVLRIVGEGLQGTLNKQSGGEIAQNLDALYSHISKLLIQANIDANPSLVEDASAVLRPIREAWAASKPSV